MAYFETFLPAFSIDSTQADKVADGATGEKLPSLCVLTMLLRKERCINGFGIVALMIKCYSCALKNDTNDGAGFFVILWDMCPVACVIARSFSGVGKGSFRTPFS